nr:G protein-coupled receptor [Proales similis]
MTMPLQTNTSIANDLQEPDGLLADLNETVEFNFEDWRSELQPAGVTELTRVLAATGIVLSLIGILGNLFSIVVLLRPSMKRLATYSYLLGLSICDEISLVLTVVVLSQYALPDSVWTIDSRNNYQKLLTYVYPVTSSAQALSVWITLAFTIDRYLYVCQPYFGREYCNRKNALIVLVCLYLVAVVYSIPQFLERTWVAVDVLGFKEVFLTYTRFGQNKYFIYIYHLFVYCAFVFFIPFTTIVVLNCFLVNDIIKSNKRHRELSIVTSRSSNQFERAKSISDRSRQLLRSLNCAKSRSSDNNHGESSIDPCLSVPSAVVMDVNSSLSLGNDVTIMLVGLVFTFLFCQTPSSVLRLIMFRNLAITFQPMYYSSLDVSNFLIVTNSTLNCILYVMLGRKFRREFIATFFSRCC